MVPRMSFSEGPEPQSPKAHGIQGNLVWLKGYLLLFGCFVFFVVSMYSLVFSKWMPTTGHPVLDWISSDHYYCLLVPLLIPTTFLAIYFNWVAMKFFRHN
eukprot:GILJ01007603.1.p1 GENE.GILJ01007603.1~~GILJ01007603.1.p1  ORF type:complete len:100 (-),score=6.61 GILJ01007603.1:129-428(-)